MSDSRLGLTVEVSNPKSKFFGRIGKITNLNRGNVTVELTPVDDQVMEVCVDHEPKIFVTRWTSLKECK